MSDQVDVQIADGLHVALQPTIEDFTSWYTALANVASLPEGEICVRLCDAEESAELNGSFRGKPTATNVLSFPADPDLPEPVLGDLAICWPVVAREAQEQGKSERDHLAHLFVHGVLHLAGFDHEIEAEAQRMEALEIRALDSLGIANPYL